MSSKFSGYKPHEFGGMGVGMYGASPFGQQSRDIVASQREPEAFPDNYGSQFYRQEGEAFNDDSYFGQ